jgi:hypothetical protein
VDRDRLLPGEDPCSHRPDDAAHWVDVYSELLTFKHELLRESTKSRKAMVPAARKEIEQTDLVVLEAEAERLERRVRFWRSRLAELRAPS